MEDKIIKVECIDNSISDLSKKQYEVLDKDNNSYLIIDDCNNEVWYNKIRFIPVTKEKQSENAQDKENRCYNKECKHIKDNQCYILKTNNCEAVIKVAPNYEEEYNKLKEKNKVLIELNIDYEKRLDNQGKRIKTDGNQIQKLFKEIDELKKEKENEIKQYEKDKKIVCDENFELTIDNSELKKAIKEGIESVKECREVLESKNKSIEAFGEAAATSDRENQKLKETIKTLASLL